MQSMLGLLLGVGFGAIVGFISFAIMEKRYGSSLVFFLPSGPLRVGILCGLLLGIAGGVIGLITGAFRLRTFPAAALGVVIFAFLKGRRLYYDGRLRMDGVEALLLFELALIGVLVALTLPHVG